MRPKPMAVHLGWLAARPTLPFYFALRRAAHSSSLLCTGRQALGRAVRSSSLPCAERPAPGRAVYQSPLRHATGYKDLGWLAFRSCSIRCLAAVRPCSIRCLWRGWSAAAWHVWSQTACSRKVVLGRKSRFLAHCSVLEVTLLLPNCKFQEMQKSKNSKSWFPDHDMFCQARRVV